MESGLDIIDVKRIFPLPTRPFHRQIGVINSFAITDIYGYFFAVSATSYVPLSPYDIKNNMICHDMQKILLVNRRKMLTFQIRTVIIQN